VALLFRLVGCLRTEFERLGTGFERVDFAIYGPEVRVARDVGFVDGAVVPGKRAASLFEHPACHHSTRRLWLISHRLHGERSEAIHSTVVWPTVSFIACSRG
jgi:hypothetical protein